MGVFTSFFFLSRHSSFPPEPPTPPCISPYKAHWVERERKRNGKEEGVERHYAYENVLKEVWFMYALDADSITGQWLKWDLSRNTEATWSNSVSLLAMRAAGETTDGWERGCNRVRKGRGKKREIEEAYLQPGHTHLTHRERVNCNLPFQDWGGSQTGVHLKDVGETERSRNWWQEKREYTVCSWITVVNCEHHWLVFRCVHHSAA